LARCGDSGLRARCARSAGAPRVRILVYTAAGPRVAARGRGFGLELDLRADDGGMAAAEDPAAGRVGIVGAAEARRGAGARAHARAAGGLADRDAGAGEPGALLVPPAGMVAGASPGDARGTGMRRRGPARGAARAVCGGAARYGGGGENGAGPFDLGGN